MIPYVEILEKYTLKPFALIEPSECWFEIAYYDKGQFEIYAPASPTHLNALHKGNYVKIPNKPFIWVINAIEYMFNADGARMISAKGYEAAKAITEKRIIRDPLELPNGLQNALEMIFTANLGTGAIQQRRINGFSWTWSGLNGKTTDAQATRGNLWEFTSNLLKLHKVGSKSVLNNGEIVFETVNGADKSDTVIFSQSLDNLISATYLTSDEDYKTNCQIVSTFNEQEEENQQTKTVSHDYVTYEPIETAGGSGIDRAEISISSNLSTKVKDEHGDEMEILPDSAQYIAMQQAEGAATLAEKQVKTEFNGEIDLANSLYVFGEDFNVGDLVRIIDEYFGYTAKARITKYTIKQDAGGYGEEAEYGNE